MDDPRGRPMETSCGFILVNYDSVLLLQYPQGHWSFPKGHVEDSDGDHHITASRELSEETGIADVTIDDEWNSRTQYSFTRRGRNIPKQVYWYIAETEELNVTLSEEHTNYMWLDFDEAEAQLTFKQEKELLRSARSHMQQMGKAV
ncbi:MAG: NUDIX domain-containing protein [Candidatus Thermoplasmatota archaeon]|nr:NUDIX domain-containing protein [Candidatus Thermoplasmatota archaeon]